MPMKRRKITPEERAYRAMITRCYNRNAQEYHNYGGRGIQVCERWQTGRGGAGFQNFLADMGTRPSPTYSLDRRDNSAGYTPENCFWATKVEQSRNRRSCVMVNIHGRMMSLSEASDLLGIRYSTLLGRARNGTDLTKPTIRTRPRKFAENWTNARDPRRLRGPLSQDAPQERQSDLPTSR
jgi:hypothetical protein